MSSLPADLFKTCRTILLQCREFQSYKALRSLFIVEPLAPFRIGLPEATNPVELVDLCLEHLVIQRLSGGHPVLPVFLETLRDRYDFGDALRDELEQLYRDVLRAMARPLPQNTPPARRKQLLFERLLQLDFRLQVRLVKQVTALHRVVAFLVHGPPDSGQNMLAYRLARLQPEWESGQQISIDVGSNGIGKSSRALWAQIAKKLYLPPNTTPIELVRKVNEWWYTQDVIFTFHTVDYMPPDFLSGWIEEFWGPLTAITQQSYHKTKRRTHLLMFLIDYAGDVSKSNVTFAQEIRYLTSAPVPLLLPSIGLFREDDLEFWIDAAAEVLPNGLTAKTLLASSRNGVPQLVYEKICEHCGFSWEGEISR